MSVSLGQLRYRMEHELLPERFQQDGKKFLDALLKPGYNIPYSMLVKQCEIEDVVCTYHSEQFVAVDVSPVKSWQVVMVTMPKPESETNCDCMYFFVDTNTGRRHLFMVELSSRENEYYLCGWRNGAHFNYGTCTLDKKEQMERMKEMFSRLK